MISWVSYVLNDEEYECLTKDYYFITRVAVFITASYDS